VPEEFFLAFSYVTFYYAITRFGRRRKIMAILGKSIKWCRKNVCE